MPGHLLPDGRCIPGTFAEHDELRAIAKSVGHYGGIMQTVMNYHDHDNEIDLIGEEASYCRGSLFSVLTGEITNLSRQLDEKVMAFRRAGRNVTGVTIPRSGGGLGGLVTNYLLFPDAWNELRKLDFDSRLIGQNQGVQFPIARCYTEVEAASLMVDKAASMFDAGEPCGAEANMAKMLASEASWRAGDVCMQTHGGFAFAKEYHIERKFRETRLYQIAPISTNLILSFIGEQVLDLPRSF